MEPLFCVDVHEGDGHLGFGGEFDGFIWRFIFQGEQSVDVSECGVI